MFYAIARDTIADLLVIVFAIFMYFVTWKEHSGIRMM
jgi:hypothetical protein